MRERLQGVAAELVKMQVDVLVKAGPQAASAAQKLSLNCFQLPSIRSQLISISLTVTDYRHRVGRCFIIKAIVTPLRVPVCVLASILRNNSPLKTPVTITHHSTG